MPMTTYITDEMRTAIGSEYGQTVSYPVSASDIRRWAIAIYYPDEPPAMFWEGEVTAPEEFNPFAWIVAEPAGRRPGSSPTFASVEATLGISELPTEFMLNGGCAISYGVPMLPGDVITSVKRLDGYEERTGRLGLMLFTRMTDRWVNQRGEHVKSNTTTLIRY